MKGYTSNHIRSLHTLCVIRFIIFIYVRSSMYYLDSLSHEIVKRGKIKREYRWSGEGEKSDKASNNTHLCVHTYIHLGG